ncbi:MAG TPA: hypothetical protein VMT62_00760 [Syntrophorhabdaceae bacterium]|nr:hypothetical protein [Syntrophorhabdaceae bacterium]
MVRNRLLNTLIGVSLIAFGATAAFADDINIYGASAEQTFWTALAPAWLKDTGDNGAGCPAANVSTRTSGSNFIAQGTGCSLGNGTITIRVTAKNSLEGIKAVKEEAMLDSDPCTSTGLAYRTMLSGTGANTTGCYDVTIGASDVASSAFAQQSTGNVNGPQDGARGTNVKTFVAAAEDMTGYDLYRPVVVPFGFFVNNSVKVRTCVAGTPNAGVQCSADADCLNTVPLAGDCGTVSQTITDVSRQMATMIFSGQAYNWTDFGAGYDTNPIEACIRHAGSGTVATLDWAVMRGNNKWGWNLVTTEQDGGPYVWFNNGTGTEMNCVNTQTGGIGFADADQAESCGTGKTYVNTAAVKYNGFYPRRITIRNGQYDNFWSAQHLYVKAVDDTPVVQKLMQFANDPTKITAMGGNPAKYWASQAEMVYWKDDPSAYPGYRGADSPQTP